jgi:molecular chaperone GrpE
MVEENQNKPTPKHSEGQSDPQNTEAAVQAEILAGEAEQVEALEEQLQEWQAKAQDYLDGWQRSRAEFANYKKRLEREQLQARQSAAASVIKRYLEILDDLDRALRNRPAEGEGSAWASGIELIYQKFISVLEAEGVTQMDAQGQYFDPNFHEAISHEENDHLESGQIIEVVKPGYMFAERVLRPALVRVAK